LPLHARRRRLRRHHPRLFLLRRGADPDRRLPLRPGRQLPGGIGLADPGLGPGAGTHKFSLPEPHTDYIFSVIGEEFGIIACLAIAILYMTIVVRVLV